MAHFTDSPPSERLTYTLAEVAAITRISRTVLFELIRKGELPIVKLGRRTLIRRAVIEEFLSTHERRAS